MPRLSPKQINELERLCPGGVQQDISLAAISQWRIGGSADVIIRPSTLQQLANLRRWFYHNDMKHLTIGASSNLLFSDDGLLIPCIQLGNRLSQVTIDGNTVNAQAGAWVPGLARLLMQAGLAGGEHTCGIPGTLGGLICMNGGSQRKGISNNLKYIESVNLKGDIIKRPVNECGFSYRESIFQENNEVISSAIMFFKKGRRANIRKSMLTILAERNAKFPRKLPNCGSVFKSNPAMYEKVGTPGAVIERLGFKGTICGGAQVSLCHSNFIVNNGNAKAKDVLELIAIISLHVMENTGFYMEPEVKFVTESGEVLPSDFMANK